MEGIAAAPPRLLAPWRGALAGTGVYAGIAVLGFLLSVMGLSAGGHLLFACLYGGPLVGLALLAGRPTRAFGCGPLAGGAALWMLVALGPARGIC